METVVREPKGQKTNMQQTIVLVADEFLHIERLARTLRANGFQVTRTFYGRQIVLTAHSSLPYQQLPQLESQEQAALRSAMILLTPTKQEPDDALPMDSYQWMVLRGRLRAQIQRIDAIIAEEDGERVIHSMNLRIDRDRRQVWRDDKLVPVSTRLFDLLVYFVQNRGIVLTRERLLERVWGYEFLGDTRTVDVHVRWLRLLIEENPGKPRLLLTVRRVGYRLVEL